MKNKVYFFPPVFRPLLLNSSHARWHPAQFLFLDTHFLLKFGDLRLHVPDPFFYNSFIRVFWTLFGKVYYLGIKFVLSFMVFLYHFPNFQSLSHHPIFTEILVEFRRRWSLWVSCQNFWLVQKIGNWLEFLYSPIGSKYVFRWGSNSIEVDHTPSDFLLVIRGGDEIIILDKFFLELSLCIFCSGIVGAIIVNDWFEIWLLEPKYLKIISMCSVVSKEFLESGER